MTIDFYGRYYERSENADHPYHLEGIDRSELKHLICDSKPIGFPWKEATIVRSSMEAKMELILISSEQGYFIIQCGEKDKFVLWDETLIREIIRPDDIEFPLGCVLPVESAWKVISFFLDTGKLSDEFNWITWDSIPEDANWIEC